VACALRM